MAIVADEIKKGGFDLIIVDEATHYKNAQTTRWKTLNKLLTDDTWLWMMTGTPAAQSPVDAYGLAKMVNKNLVPRFFGSFKDQVMSRVSQFRWVIKPAATEIVFNSLQPAIRFTKEECLDLPPMVYAKREVELTNQQKKYYLQIKNKMVMEVTGAEVTAMNAAVSLSKLLQISSGAVYTDAGDVLEFDIRNRYKVLREVIDESSQKILVFVPFKHAINILTEKLRADGITTEVIQGSVSAPKRTEIFRTFQTTNTIVWWGPTSSLETYDQANARVHRSGQKHKSTVIQLQGSAAEKHVYRLLDKRINVHADLINLYKEILD